jgi:hypothetical protein
MGAIFISYRRDDTEGQAGRLFEDLTREFGRGAVFMDVAAIEPGRDFRRVIDQQVASCAVLLTLIGRNWVDSTDASGTRRLNDPTDFVRLETASALRRDIPVVPVLVHGARMPRADQLPDELKELAFRNAVELTHARWSSDVQLLISSLRSHVVALQDGSFGTAIETALRGTATARGVRTPVVALVAALAALGAGGAWWMWSAGRSDAQPAAAQRESTAPTEARRVGLVGTWEIPQGGCTLKVEKDDGDELRGVCGSGDIEHRFVGKYVAKDAVTLTITRIDWPRKCNLTVTGKLLVLKPDRIEITQPGWPEGCEVRPSGPATTVLTRVSA